MNTTKALGDRGEAAAAQYLRKRGCQLLASQWRCRYGELDLVARDRDGTVCFVEVKTRSAGAIGLLPQSLLSRTAGVGNTALTGAAAVLLSRAARAELEDLQGRCAYLELSTHPRFSGHFIDCMFFAHAG